MRKTKLGLWASVSGPFYNLALKHFSAFMIVYIPPLLNGTSCHTCLYSYAMPC